MKVTGLLQEFIVQGEAKAFDSGHASTLVQLKDGTVVSAWFGGSAEKAPDVEIWVSRRVNGVWERPGVAASVRGVAQWNPVLFQKSDGTIVLFFKVGAEISSWETWYTESCDGGVTFSPARKLMEKNAASGRGPVKNKPIRLTNGTVLAPASLEGALWDVFVDISDDDCATWKKSGPVPIKRASYGSIHRPYDRHALYGKGGIQPTLWEDEKGEVHMLFRTDASRIFRSDSTDGGHTWSLAYDTGLPNNNSGIDLVRLANSDIVLVYNPRENLPNYYKGPRTPLSVAVSKDNGETFTRLLDLETEAGNFSYPAVITNEKNEILITYTWNRETIRFAKLTYED